MLAACGTGLTIWDFKTGNLLRMPSTDPTGPAQTVMLALREASALATLYDAAVARALALSPSDLECLDFVSRNQPATAGSLARATGLTTGAVTGVIDRLELAGFVRRERSSPDRRVVLVVPTASFESEVLPLFEPMRRRQAEALARFDDDQLTLVAQFLHTTLAAARDALEELEPTS